MKAIVPFLHPAQEAKLTMNNFHSAQRNHSAKPSRKLLKVEGNSITSDGVIHMGHHSAWAEWGSQSKIHQLSSGGDYNSFIHEPYLDLTQPTPNHPLDPYIFGSNFNYTACQQTRGNSTTKLAELDRKSIILFGSKIQGAFRMDTLFVVADYVDYTLGRIDKLFAKTTITDTLRLVTIEPLLLKAKKEQLDLKRRFYIGANYEQRNEFDGMFSFVPCKSFNSENESRSLFKQPLIDIQGIINHECGQGFKINNCGEAQLKNYWSNILNQCFQQGLYAGVSFGNPKKQFKQVELRKAMVA